MGTNVLEVQEDPGARTPLDFDARLFILMMFFSHSFMQRLADSIQGKQSDFYLDCHNR